MDWRDQPGGLRDFYKKAISLRRRYSALRRGGWHTLLARPGQGLYGYCREDERECIAVFLNNQYREASISGDLARGEILWEKGWGGEALEPMGFLVVRKENSGEDSA